MSRSEEIFSILRETYPNAAPELEFDDDFELLVAVILSAQCTDKRVNVVTRELFKVANTPEQFAKMDQSELERLIYSCGFYRNKAKNIIAASRAICERFGGKVPRDFDDLTSLSGVGRKTANVVSAVAFGGDGVAVDTHVFRTSRRLGLARGKTPYEVERELLQVIPKGERGKTHHLLIFHGRYRCKAISPRCEDCPLKNYCEYTEVTKCTK